MKNEKSPANHEEPTRQAIWEQKNDLFLSFCPIFLPVKWKRRPASRLWKNSGGTPLPLPVFCAVNLEL